MNLNKKQKIALVAGIIFLIILVATTPRITLMHGRYDEPEKQINLGEAFLRVVVVVLITGGLIVLLKSGKKEDQ